MELKFDIKGHLVPHERIEIILEEFEEVFVKSFDINSTRSEIFQNYLKFVSDFKSEVTSNFVHWINGSFSTTKESPEDIDFVSLIKYEDYEKKRKIIDTKFRLRQAKKLYGVDAYTVEIYPEEHKRYLFCKSDLVYWNNWFSKTKKN